MQWVQPLLFVLLIVVSAVTSYWLGERIERIPRRSSRTEKEESNHDRLSTESKPDDEA